ncbi:GNAT family N-acyltransferase [Pseudidiomarina sp. WS423]|uniref:GNAT family N-acyltransferase n=1 Tax=Pseudidiomarina sp. WS423 TaxID=3425124 RepID=UPI003D6F8201
MIQVEQVAATTLPAVYQHQLLQRPLLWCLRGLLCEQHIQEFERRYPAVQGLEFVEQVLDFFNFTYTARDNELDHIPSDGRVVIVANHPIGSLDGLALLKLVSAQRGDVKILANDMLGAIGPLQELMFPVRVFRSGSNGSAGERERLKKVYQHLQDEGALIVFPAGEVSRLRPQGVRDGHWQTGFLKLALRCQAPVLPVFIGAHNSPWFYGASMLYKPLATLLLVQEMVRQRSGHINFRIGELIPLSSFAGDQLSLPMRAKLFRKHVYRLGQDRPGLLKSQRPIARSEARERLQQALQDCECLGETADGKSIYLYRYQGNSPIMRELGRLREVAFRAVDEGTGKRRDLDNFDTWYLHLILWDPQDLEIAGAYRLGDTKAILAQHGVAGLYSQTLFEYQPQLLPLLEQGLELGRSFVQPRYWGKRSLDYLWQGIGALLRRHPEYRYLFGPVTMSASLPKLAQDAMVQFFAEQFPDPDGLAVPRAPYQALERPLPPPSGDYLQDFTHLKHHLAHQGVAIPTLYKQYADLCEPGGVRFIGFNVDADFADAVDGLVWVDITRLKPGKKARYLSGSSQ